jgi:hypothetical protein
MLIEKKDEERKDEVTKGRERERSGKDREATSRRGEARRRRRASATQPIEASCKAISIMT